MKNPICITAYEQHQKFLRDKHAREKFLRKEGEAIGEARGFVKGKSKAQKEIAISLKERGMSETEIADIMKISIEEIMLMLK